MGKPSLACSDIPVNANGDKAIDEPIAIIDREFKMTCVSMGNPHAVMFIDEHPSDFDLENTVRRAKAIRIFFLTG